MRYVGKADSVTPIPDWPHCHDLLKICTSETKPNHNPNTNTNPNPTYSTKP